jgi:general secretion pathway protein M
MRLARREKYLVSLAGCSIALLILFHFFILPFFAKKEDLKEGVKNKEVALEEIIMMSAEYKARKKSYQGLQELLARREKGVTLFSFLEKAADKAEIKGHIKYMKPSVSEGTGGYKESMVEMKLEGITLKQLVGYLYRIESPENVISIKRISIKENKKESGYLDAILQVLTFQ